MNIRLGKWGRRAVISLGVFALAACGSLTLTSSTSGGAPVLQIAQSPADAVRAFLDAWNRLDYQGMYAQLSAQNQGLSTFSVFQAIYQEADKTLGTKGVTYSIHDTQEQGDSAAVNYDAAIQSSVFGAIDDNGRVMRVVRAPDNTWRVAWSTMDIVSGYAPGTRLSMTPVQPQRGNIYDHNGQLMVEQDGQVVELYVTRQSMPDESRCIDLLSVLLRESRADLEKWFAPYFPETTFYVGDLDPNIYSAREAELVNTCGVGTNTRTTRRYVGHGIDTHLIGYVGNIPSDQLQTYLDNGYDASDLVGLSGIEQQYEAALAGKSQRVLRVVEPGGMTVRELAGTSGEPSHNVTLTVDLNLQWATAQALSDAFNAAGGNWASRDHATGGGAIVMDIHTGAILALASYPSFDPGIFNGDTPMPQVGDYIHTLQTDVRTPFSNRVVQEQYAPGSTFKIVTLSAAAEEGVFKPDQTFDCQMEWHGAEYGDSQPVRYDWRQFEKDDAHFPTGEITMSQALTASCNPFFYQMGALLFNTRGPILEEYAKRMGLGNRTGIELPVPEAQGLLPVLTSTDQAISAAIGQLDTQVTALQMVRMVAGIANGGTLYKPYVVQQVGGENGTTPLFVAQPTVAGDMGLSQATLDIVRQGMCDATTSAAVNQTNGKPLGTSWFVFDDPPPDGVGIAPYSVCGKTGTAQTAREEPIGWYVVFAPADDPQIAVAAVIPYGREGSETAAPIVRRILDAYFNAPQAPWPLWWSQNPYYPLEIPEGSTGG